MFAVEMVLAALAMAQAAPPPPASEPAAPPIEVVGPQQNRPDRMVCRLEEQTSSRINRPRTCRTASEWERNRAENQREIERSIAMSNSAQFANQPGNGGRRHGISRCGLRGAC